MNLLLSRWVVGGSGTGLQTAETGWQVYYQRYGDWLPHLFIFTTQNGYSLPIQGYYNLDSGTPFVQTDSSVIIAGSISPVSTYGGAQYNVTLTFYRDQGGSHNWWLKYGNTWVGYFPNTWFNSSGLANQGSEVDFGGEIVNDNIGGVHTTTQMGSGHFPSEGFYYSAYVKRINYIDMNGSGQNASSLIRNVTDASYYDLALYNSSDTNLLNYFFFGGPGGSQTTRIISLSGNLAFGNVAMGNFTQNTLTINNTGNSTMTVSSISYPSGFSGNWSGTISAGGSQNVTVTFSPTSATSYGGTVTVNSDKTSGVNTVLASGTGTVVLLPDLTISGSVAASPASVASGGTIQVSWTEKNQGTVASSPAHNTKIFLATSAYGTTYQIGYFGPMNTLGVNATQAYSQPCVVSTTIPTGNYYVTAFVDCDQQVTESSDNNNIGSSSPTTFAVTPLQYTITASAGSGGTVNPNGSFSKNPGDNQTFTASPNANYVVNQWLVDGSVVQYGGTGYTLSNIQAAHTVQVNFTYVPPQYTITASAGSGGTISPNGSFSKTAGDSQTFTASPNANYVVNQWTIDSVVAQSGGLSYTLANIQAGHSVQVTFTYAPTQYTINASAGSGGAISPSGSFAASVGSSQTFTAYPNANYAVNQWSLDSVVTQTGGTTYTLNNIQSGHNVQVTFVQGVSVTVQGNPSGVSFLVDGTTYLTPQTFSWVSGSSHPIGTTSPQSGGTGVQYIWSNWSDAGAVSHNVAPTSGTTFTANFSTQYRLDTSVSPAGGGTVVVNPPGTWFPPSQALQLTASPASGYAFSSWAGVDSSSGGGASVTMSGYRNVTANFAVVSSAYTFITLAGSANAGSQNGAGAAAGFNCETGTASDKAGNVYVADTYNSTIRKISPAGMVTTVAGLAGNPGSANGIGSAARFLCGQRQLFFDINDN